MARTKQTSSKATGGIAPRVPIKKDRQTLASLKVAVPPNLIQETLRSHLEARSGPFNNEFCMFCQDGVRDGEDCLYECDEHDCPRAVCTQCISIPAGDVQLLKEPDVKFRCVHCHTAMDKKLKEVTPYYGFYRDDQPVLQSFLPIIGELALSKRSQISSKPVLIIHFKVVGFENTASPVDAVHSYLRPYFPNGGLRLVDVVFDLGTRRKINRYSQWCENLVKEIMEEFDYQKVCLVITNHTNDENGDPFLGYFEGESYVANTVPEFMSALLDPWSKVIRRSKTATLFFLGCGAIINKSEGFSGLRLAVVDHAIPSTVAFTAKHFHPTFASHLLIAFAQLVMIECFPLREAFPAIIEQSGLGMHSDIVLLTTTPQDSGPAMPLPECTRYSWAHSTSRPWGNTLPLQCPQCGCPTQWNRLKANFSHKSMIFECSFANCGRVKDKSEARKPRLKLVCKAPKNSKLIPGKRRNASWLEIALDFSQSETGICESESDVEMV